METKICTAEQISQLKVGTVIKRFPSTGTHLDTFDKNRSTHIDTFIVKSIHPEHKMIGLAMTGPYITIICSSR